MFTDLGYCLLLALEHWGWWIVLGHHDYYHDLGYHFFEDCLILHHLIHLIHKQTIKCKYIKLFCLIEYIV